MQSVSLWKKMYLGPRVNVQSKIKNKPKVCKKERSTSLTKAKVANVVLIFLATFEFYLFARRDDGLASIFVNVTGAAGEGFFVGGVTTVEPSSLWTTF